MKYLLLSHSRQSITYRKIFSMHQNIFKPILNIVISAKFVLLFFNIFRYIRDGNLRTFLQSIYIVVYKISYLSKSNIVIFNTNLFCYILKINKMFLAVILQSVTRLHHFNDFYIFFSNIIDWCLKNYMNNICTCIVRIAKVKKIFIFSHITRREHYCLVFHQTKIYSQHIKKNFYECNWMKYFQI